MLMTYSKHKLTVSKCFYLELKMTTPVIRIVNPDAPVKHQQAVLVATKEARYYREKKMVFPSPPPELLNKATALPHAEKLLQAEGKPAPSHQLCLGNYEYENAPFHWQMMLAT
ncbi:hypothetical protein SRHO_G00112780 [Serrasalmus rhombeus]